MRPSPPGAIAAIRAHKFDGCTALGYFGTADFANQAVSALHGIVAALQHTIIEGSGINDDLMAGGLDGVQTLLAVLHISEECRRAA